MSPELARQLRAAAEFEKRKEFLGLILGIPESVVSYDIAHLVAMEMAKVAAERLFPVLDGEDPT